MTPNPGKSAGVAQQARKYYFSAALAISSFAVLVYFFVPALREALSQEDHLVENLSAALFLVCFLLGSVRALKLNSPSRKILLFVPLLGLFAFLDEISYGQRIFNWDTPIINEVSVENVHFILPLLRNLLWPYLPHLAQVILAVAVFLGAYLLALRAKLAGQALARVQRRVLYLFFIVTIVSGIGALILLLSIPGDPKNVWLLGYSLTRVLMAGAMLLALFFSLWLAVHLWRQPVEQARLLKQLEALLTATIAKALATIAAIGFLVGLGYLMLLPFNPFRDQYYYYAIRLAPLVFWATIESALLLLSSLAWRGRLTQPASHYLEPVQAFLTAYPAFFFVLLFLVLLVASQPFDLKIGKHYYEKFIEELLEFNAALAMLFASLMIPQTNRRKVH